MKYATAFALALLVLVGLGLAFQWRETTINDNGNVVLIRTNRFTGTTQVFRPTTGGWAKPGVPGRTGNAELDRTVDELLAQNH